MEELQVGRFTIVKGDMYQNQAFGLEYYDVVLKEGEKVVKQCTGCIGAKSAEFWKEFLIEQAIKLNILYDRLGLSANPAEVIVIEKWVKELLR